MGSAWERPVVVGEATSRVMRAAGLKGWEKRDGQEEEVWGKGREFREWCINSEEMQAP